MTKSVVLAALACMAAVPVHGQPPRRGESSIASGWRAKTDRSGDRIEDVRFTQVGGAFRLTTGPHVALWRSSDRASGDYTVSARFTKLRSSRSNQEESYGLFIAGTNLDGSRRNYLYCVVFGSGSAMVRHRNGNETATLLGKTSNDAISRMGPDGASDEISMWVRDGRVGCSVNGVEVFSAPTEDMIGPGKLVSTDGIFGVRASHDLDLRIEEPRRVSR